MQFAADLFLYLGLTASVFFVFGLFKPWIMLWWEDIQNRKKVIKLYGTIASLCLLVYGMITLLTK